MVIPKTDLKEPEEQIKKEKIKFEIEEKELEELPYKKKTYNWIYKLLKLNPIYPINDIIRYIINK